MNWGSSQYADDYTLFRHTADDSGSATSIATTASTSYTDYSAVPGTTYYYWTKANNSAGSSTFSNGDDGFASLPPPPPDPPASVAASDGTFDSKVRIEWAPVAHTTSYQIYRSLNDDPAGAFLLSTTPNTLFDDESAVPQQTYYYWIKAANAAGATDFSDSDSGWTQVGVPQNLYATNDLFDHMVRVTWNSVPNATAYRIFRNTSGFSLNTVEIATVAAPLLRYEDSSADAGETYYYWVKAELAGGQIGDLSDRDSGRRADGPATGTGFVAADDPRSVSFDPVRNRAYIVTGKGIVEIYDLDQQQVINGEWNTDGGLSGADLIDAQNQTLVLAQTRVSGEDRLGRMDLVDLETENIQSLRYPLAPDETGVYDVTILDGDRALFTTSSEGADWVPLRMVDLGSGTFSILDASGSSTGGPGGIKPDSLLSRTPDRRHVAIQEANTSSGPFFTYDIQTEQFGAPIAMGALQRNGSINADGSLLAMSRTFTIEIRSTTTGYIVQAFGNSLNAFVFHPTQSFLFAVDTDSDNASIRVFSTIDWSEVDNIDLGRGILGISQKYLRGHLSIDASGHWLAVGFDDGIKILDVSSYRSTPPDAPLSLTATDNSTADGISITWDAAFGASAHNLWRSSINDPDTALQIASGLTEPTFLDASINAGATYYYWAQGTNEYGPGPFGPSDSGERRVAPPTNFASSDGLYPDRITLSWDSSVSAISYTLYRSQTDNPGTAVEIASSLTSTAYEDFTVAVSETYYYWVIAHNNSGPSEFSSSASGATKINAPANPTIDVESSASVNLSWSAVPGATSYRVLRGTTNDPQNATQLGQGTYLSFADSTANPGDLYYWFIQAVNGSNDSDSTQASVSGRRIFEPPQLLSSTGNRRDKVTISWSAVVGSVDSYEIYRSSVDDITTASLVIETTDTAADDLTAPTNRFVRYWIRAKSATTIGEWSPSFLGRRRGPNFTEFAAEHGLVGDNAHYRADPDNDGADSYREWLQGGTDPANASSRPTVATSIQSIGVADYLCISYLRLPSGTENGDTYEHQSGDYRAVGTLDLNSGPWDQSCISTNPPDGLGPPPDGYEWGCFRLPLSVSEAPQGFIKLLVN